MLSKVDRYLLKELSLTVLATVLVFIAVELSHRLALYLSDAASGGLARGAILTLLGLHVIRYLVVIVPPAVFLAIVLMLGRLYRDGEMSALKACGRGPSAIYRPLFLLLVPVALLTAMLSLYVVPICMELQQELQLKARQDAEISVIQAGQFRQVMGGKHVVYVGEITKEGRELREVFIQSWHPEGVAITTGEWGYQEIAESGGRYLVLRDGYRYVGNPGQGNFRTLRFERLAMLVAPPPAENASVRRESISTLDLLGSSDPSYKAELQSRLSSPISLLVIGFLAPLLAHAKPHEGRFGRVVISILVYAIYMNLMGIGEAWIKRGSVPPALGLWWVHGIFLLLGLGLWTHQYGTRFVPTTRPSR
jgi:lipopolysaccharide export system permease protein